MKEDNGGVVLLSSTSWSLAKNTRTVEISSLLTIQSHLAKTLLLSWTDAVNNAVKPVVETIMGKEGNNGHLWVNFSQWKGTGV